MRAHSALRLLPVLLALQLPSDSTPSFQLVIITEGVQELAVGSTVQCRVYRPLVLRPNDGTPKPITTPLRWRLEPADAAKIDANGILTALKPGKLIIRVSDARKLPQGRLPFGTGGWHELKLRKPAEMDGTRLPRFKGADGILGFDLGWVYDKKSHRLDVNISAWNWYLTMETVDANPRPLPWRFKANPERSHFNDEPGRDHLSHDDFARWRKYLSGATLTIESWKNGIACGKVVFTTSRKVSGEITFVARLPDRDRLLERATSPRAGK